MSWFSIGQLQSRTGMVAISRTGRVYKPLRGDAFYPGDLVETGVDGSATIRLRDGTLLHLYAGARMELGGLQTSGSPLVRMRSGRFEFIKGKFAAGDRLTIDTPFGELRNRTPGFGAGTVALGVFTFAFLPEAKADSADIALLDNGLIDYDDLKHGIYEIITKGDHPERLLVDSTTHSFVLRFRGSSVSVSEVANTPVQMAQLQNAYSDAYAHYTQGLNDPFFQQWQHAYSQPQSGPSGSGDPGSILALNGNNNNGPGFLFVPTLLSNSNDSGGSGGNGSGTPIVIIPPPPSQPQQLTVTVGSATTVNGGTLLVQTTDASHVLFSVTGLTTDDSGTLTFSDGLGDTVTVTITNGVVVAGANNTATTVNLSSFKDDATITSSLSVSDPAGNTFTASGNAVTIEKHDSVTITGAPAIGQTAIATVNDVDKDSSGITYQWYLNGNAIQGATSQTYTVTTAGTLSVIVTENDGVTYTDTVDVVSSQRNWKNPLSKDWTDVQGAWNAPSNILPSANDDVLISSQFYPNNNKAYTVTISTAGDVAHSLTLSDSNAVVLDTTGGDLSLNGGSGGLTIANGILELWGGSLEAGTIYIKSGGTLSTEGNYVLSETIWNDGRIEVANGTLEIAGFATGSTGQFQIDAGATLRLDTAESLNVLFAAATGLLILSDPTQFTGTISESGGSLQVGDVIDVSGFDAGATISYSGTTSGGTVTISEAGHTPVTLSVGANSTHWTITGLDSSGTGILIHDPVDTSATNVASDPVPITDNSSIVTVSDGTVLPLDGVIDNSGTIALASTGHSTEPQITDNVILQGGGDIVMSGGDIVGAGPASTLTNVDDTISGYGQIGSADANLALINDGTINADVSGCALTIDTGNTIINAGVLEASNGGILIVDDPVIGTGTALIAGGTLVLEGSATVSVTFDNGGSVPSYGELVLGDASHFSGQIFGFSGSEADAIHSDAVDLAGFSYGSTSYSETNLNGSLVLTVTDGDTVAVLTFDGFGGILNFASDGNGGTIITDSSVASAITVDGSVALTGSGPEDTITESVTPDGSNYIGSFFLEMPVTDSGTTTVGYAFELGIAQADVSAAQALTQSYALSIVDAQDPALSQTRTISVSIGDAGTDNFVFTPGIGADTIVNFDLQQDSIELDHFADAQTIQQLESLITSDAHGDVVINLGHDDSVTLQGVSTQQLQQVIQEGHLLLH